MRYPTLFFAALILLCSGAAAQSKDGRKVLVYSNISGCIGSPFGFTASASCLFIKRHELSAGYQFYSRKAMGIPSDFRNSSFLSNGTQYPDEDFKGLGITYGYVLYPKHKANQIRYVLRAGLAVGQQRWPYNFTRSTSQSLFSSSNYSFETGERLAAALIVHPTFDYTPRRVFGFSLGLYGIASAHFNGGGASLGILLGRVGYRTRKDSRAEHSGQ